MKSHSEIEISCLPSGVLYYALYQFSALDPTTMPIINITSSMLSKWSPFQKITKLNIFWRKLKKLSRLTHDHFPVSSSSSTQLLGQLGSRRSSSNSRFERNLKLNIRFYKEIHLAACYSCLNWGKKTALYWLKRCLNYVLSAATAAASAIIYTSQKETFGWGLTFTLKRYLDFLMFDFSLSDLWQNFDRLHSFRCVTDFINQPSPVTLPQFHRALRGLLLTSCFEAWPRRVLS